MAEGGHDANAQPLKGVVLCSTSLSQEQRTSLTEAAQQMGAIHRLDLTADVTHLIVGQLDTPKYKHTAKERPDIEVLLPEWIDALLEAWRQDHEIDLEALAQQYRLPPFYNLHICVTGFEDIDERQKLIHKIESNGAIYHGDLTREVTHLIVARPKGAKYDRAKTWRMKIVSLKWLEDGLERGMALEESSYDPLLPVEEQGQGAFARGYQKPSVLGKRQRDDGGGPAKEDAGKRRLRRTASTRLGNHSQNLWADISFAEDDDAGKTNDQWIDSKDETNDAEAMPHDETPSMAVNDISRPVSRGPAPEGHEKLGLFSRTLCLVHGHNERTAAKIYEIITTNGGQVTYSVEDLSSATDEHTWDHAVLLLPSEWTSITKGSLPEVPVGTWHVTEWWIERCIALKSVVNPENDVLSQPHLNCPIDGFKGMTITTSGVGQLAMHIAKLVRLSGASYSEDLTPRCSVLVIQSITAAQPEKIQYAFKYKIPVVFDKWLYSSVAGAQKLPVSEFDATAGAKKVSAKPHSAYPTSRGDSALQQKEKKKDGSTVQRLSATRKRGVAPSLHMIKSKAARVVERLKSQGEKQLPFLEDDASSEDDQTHTPQDVAHADETEAFDQPTVLADDTVIDAQTDGADSPQPLQELPPEMNSSRKQTDEQSLGSNKTLPSEPLPVQETSVSKEMTPEEDTRASDANGHARLKEDIESLLERQHLAPAQTEGLLKGRRRKERKLGRAASMASNSSASASFRQNTSTEAVGSAEASVPEEVGAPMPSQQLTYETPDAQEYRARMSKKMGTKLMDDGIGTRVESIGVVRDVDAGGAGVGGRVRGRHRSAKN